MAYSVSPETDRIPNFDEIFFLCVVTVLTEI